MKELYKKQFSDYLEKFIDELKKSSDEHKTIIEEKYDKYGDYTGEIKENIYKYKEDFLSEEDKLNNLFKENEIYLIDDLCISKIWNISDSDNKTAIIQYLKVFIFIFEASEEKQEDKTDNNDFEELLKKSLLDENNNLKSFCKNLNNEDNVIVNMAKSIAEDLKGDDNINDNDISKLMGNNGQGLGNLISKITGKIDNEIKSGKTSQADLLSEAQKMMGGNGNLFANLFSGLGNMNQNSGAFNPSSNPSSNHVSTDNTTKTIKKTKKKKNK